MVSSLPLPNQKRYGVVPQLSSLGVSVKTCIIGGFCGGEKIDARV